MNRTSWLVMAVLTVWGVIRGIDEAVRLYIERHTRSI